MVKMKTGASLKRHKSSQVIATPWEFIEAVEDQFGPIGFDLAASSGNGTIITNAKADSYFTKEHNSLIQPWDELRYTLESSLLWLNPPFDPITPWVKKCAEESQKGANILLLSRASLDTNWYWNYINPFAESLILTPRITFEGCKDVYPSPLMLSVYGIGTPGKITRWRWK